MLCQTYLHENRVSDKTLGVQIVLFRQAKEMDSKKLCRRPVLLAEFSCTKLPFFGNFWPLLSCFGYFQAIFGQKPCVLNGPQVAISYGGQIAVYLKFLIVIFGHFLLIFCKFMSCYRYFMAFFTIFFVCFLGIFSEIQDGILRGASFG